MLPERILQHLRVKAERGRNQRYKDRLAVSPDGLRTVVFKIWREHDNFVTGVRQRENRVDHRLGRADGHDNLSLRVKLTPHEPAALAARGLPEIRRAHRDRVLVRTKLADFLQPVGQRLRGVKIRESLREVDCAALKADARHPADDGIGEMLVSSAHFLHGGFSSLGRAVLRKALLRYDDLTCENVAPILRHSAEQVNRFCGKSRDYVQFQQILCTMLQKIPLRIVKIIPISSENQKITPKFLNYFCRMQH